MKPACAARSLGIAAASSRQHSTASRRSGCGAAVCNGGKRFLHALGVAPTTVSPVASPQPCARLSRSADAAQPGPIGIRRRRAAPRLSVSARRGPTPAVQAGLPSQLHRSFPEPIISSVAAPARALPRIRAVASTAGDSPAPAQPGRGGRASRLALWCAPFPPSAVLAPRLRRRPSARSPAPAAYPSRPPSPRPPALAPAASSSSRSPLPSSPLAPPPPLLQPRRKWRRWPCPSPCPSLSSSSPWTSSARTPPTHRPTVKHLTPTALTEHTTEALLLSFPPHPPSLFAQALRSSPFPAPSPRAAAGWTCSGARWWGSSPRWEARSWAPLV